MKLSFKSNLLKKQSFSPSPTNKNKNPNFVPLTYVWARIKKIECSQKRTRTDVKIAEQKTFMGSNFVQKFRHFEKTGSWIKTASFESRKFTKIFRTTSKITYFSALKFSQNNEIKFPTFPDEIVRAYGDYVHLIEDDFWS